MGCRWAKRFQTSGVGRVGPAPVTTSDGPGAWGQQKISFKGQNGREEGGKKRASVHAGEDDAKHTQRCVAEALCLVILYGWGRTPIHPVPAVPASQVWPVQIVSHWLTVAVEASPLCNDPAPALVSASRPHLTSIATAGTNAAQPYVHRAVHRRTLMQCFCRSGRILPCCGSSSCGLLTCSRPAIVARLPWQVWRARDGVDEWIATCAAGHVIAWAFFQLKISIAKCAAPACLESCVNLAWKEALRSIQLSRTRPLGPVASAVYVAVLAFSMTVGSTILPASKGFAAISTSPVDMVIQF